MRVIAKRAGRSASARVMVVTFSIGAPMTNDSKKLVDAPRRSKDGAITDEQHEQSGCGSAKSAPSTDPVKPVRTKYGLKYAGRTVSARPEMRMPSIMACQTFSRKLVACATGFHH